MDVWTALVFSVGSIVGGIIITQLWQHNYYKKKNFNHQMWQVKQQDTIKLQSLKKELGLKKGSTPTAPGLNIDDIKGLIGKYVGGESEPEEDDNWIQNVIMKVAEENPEMVQGLIQKFTGGGSNEETEVQTMR